MPYKNIKIGIYIIVNIINNKCYIGSSINLYNRFSTHKRLLKNNKHFNNHLQSAWNKYGESSFVFEILEEYDKEDLYYYENLFIKLFKTNDNLLGYNKRIDCKTNLGLTFSDITRERLRISHLGNKRSKEAHEKILKSQYKEVYQIDKNGKIINKFDSILKASLETNIHRTLISGVCRKITKSAGGFHWCFTKEYNKFKIPKDGRRNNKK